MTDEEKQAIDDLFSLTHINGYINLYDQKKANIYTSDLKRWQNGVKVLLNLTNNQQSEIRQYEKALHDQIIKEKLEELEHEKFKRTYLGFFPKNNCENRILLAKIQLLQELMEDK